jgi:predicted DCC family thiol-disulfide oxidoreductase YuxK
MKILVALGALAGILAVQVKAPSPTVKPLKIAPIAYYDGKCARCHGPNGSFYEQNFVAKYDDAGLIAVLKRMAEGPGGAALDQSDLAVQAAYHRAIAANAPFFSLTKAGIQASGETTGDRIKAKVLGKSVPIKVKYGIWTVKLKSLAQFRDLILTDGPVSFRPSKQAYSDPPHQKNAG